MSKFQNTTLRNKITIKHGFPFKGEFFSTEGEFIILTPGNFYEAGGFKFEEDKAKFYTGEIPEEYTCKKGDLVVAMTEQAEGLLGSSAIVPIDNRFLHNQRIGLVQVDDNEIDKMFLYHVFNTKPVRQQLRSSSSGSKVKHTSPDRIYDVIVDLPDLPAQQKIGAVLSALDAKIDLNNRINAELEAMAKTLYDYWFVQFDFPNVEGKPYKTNGGKMAWNEELKRDIPAGWEVGNILKVADLLGGGTPNTKEPSYWSGSTPFFTPKDVDSSFFVVETKQAITERGLENCSSKRFQKGTIFLTARGTVGNINIASQDMAMNQSCYALQAKSGVNYCYLHLCANDVVKQLKAKANGSVFDAIVSNDFKFTFIAIPPIDAIKQFGSITESFYEKILNNKKENQRLSALRDWLLPMLMNGQVTVSAVNQPQEQALASDKVERLCIAESKKGFAKQVLGGKIVSLFQNDPHFTSIKFQKLQYLAEHVAEADLNWNYYYQAAGPYDNVFMHTITDRLKQARWFEKQGYKFVALEKQAQIEGYYQGFFKPVANRLDHLFSLLADVTDVEAEIIATLYAVWNNRIIGKQPVDEEFLIEDFYRWSDRKLLYSQEQLQKSLQWMHTHNIIPNGFGREIKKAQVRGKK